MTTQTHQQINVARFDELAANWDENPVRAGIARGVIGSLSQCITLRADMDVLDYGCGTGLVAFSLAPKVNRLVAVDSSDGMLDVVRGKAHELGVSNVTALNLDLSRDLNRNLSEDSSLDQRFDLIYTSMTMHHIVDTAAILTRFFELLKPGGQLAIIDLDSEDGSFHGDMPGIAHQGFDRAALQQSADSAGFSELHIETAHVVSRDREGEKRDFPLFIMVGRRN